MVQENRSSDLKIELVKQRSLSGVVALISRTFIVQIISFIATLALTIFLDPSVYGIFYLVTSIVNFLSYFSDIGLAAALIQKKDNLDHKDLSTTFTLQQILVVGMMVLAFLFRGQITSFYNLDQSGVNLLYATAIAFFLSSLKTIPTVILERQIKFDKLIISQIAETLAFNLVAVYFAWRGYGVNSFSMAVIVRGAVGLISIYLIAPWRPSFGISKISLKQLLKFGLPYQTNTFLALIKDDGMTLLLSKIIGATGLGYIGWASRWANLPLRTFMDNVSKVAFPAFSRLQHEPERLTRAIELSVKYLCLLVFPLLVGMGFFANPLIHLIPKYLKWLPALIPLYLYLYNAAWASISSTLTNALNAVGKINITFKLMVMWTTLTWVIMPVFAHQYGFVGVAYATAIIATSSAATVIMAQKHLKFNLFNSIKTPMLSCLILSLVLFAGGFFATSTISIILLIVFSALVYLSTVTLIEGKDFVKQSLSYFRNQQ